jgi:hypothetical protein
MRRYLIRFAERIAPTAYTRLRRLSVLDDEDASAATIFLRLEDEVNDLRRQLDELRRDNRRITELHDLVFERLHRDNPLDQKPVD